MIGLVYSEREIWLLTPHRPLFAYLIKEVACTIKGASHLCNSHWARFNFNDISFFFIIGYRKDNLTRAGIYFSDGTRLFLLFIPVSYIFVCICNTCLFIDLLDYSHQYHPVIYYNIE